VGEAFHAGAGVTADDAQAALWLAKAAAQNYAGAKEALAQLPSLGGHGLSQTQFRSLMNQVFGAGIWRETGGYRTAAQENELRAEGALTVPAGALSRHSLGSPQQPGAYDVVVEGMTPAQVAQKLRASGLSFRRLFPEGLHGSQGPHLHVEPM